MRFSRLGVIALLAIAVIFTTNCSYFNRILSRKNLVDGSIAYRERKFEAAEELFRRAATRDPDGTTEEGKIAQVFLARTLHSQYIGDREKKHLAEQAVEAYRKALVLSPNDQLSYKAVADLYSNLQRTDDWQKWVTERSANMSIEPQNRAEALTALAAKQNACASEITDTEATKKTVKVDGKDVYQFIKPANAADFEKLKVCVAEGTKLIGQAMSLEPDSVKTAKNLDVKTLTDAALKQNHELIKVFEQTRSYNASLKSQAMRLDEMEGRTDDKNRLKPEADQAKADFNDLSKINKAIKDEMDARVAAEQEAENANANKNAKK